MPSSSTKIITFPHEYLNREFVNGTTKFTHGWNSDQPIFTTGTDGERHIQQRYSERVRAKRHGNIFDRLCNRSRVNRQRMIDRVFAQRWTVRECNKHSRIIETIDDWAKYAGEPKAKLSQTFPSCLSWLRSQAESYLCELENSKKRLQTA